MKHKVNYTGGHFPNEKQTLLLKAALFQNSEAIMYFIQWLRLCGLDNLSTESKTFLSDFMDTLDLGSQRMLPLVIHNVGENNHPYFRFLSGVRKNYWVKLKRIEFFAGKAQQILEQNGIPCIFIKGLDIASRFYPNEAMRPMNDGDILIPFSNKEKALGLIMNGVFGNNIIKHDFFVKDYLHAIHLNFGNQVDIDLHWNIVVEYGNDCKASDFIWNAVKPINIKNRQNYRMSDTHAFFISLIHGKSYDIVPPFRWVADTIMIIRNAQFIDWDEVLFLTKRFPFKAFIKKAIPYLRQEFDLIIPEKFIIELEKIEIQDLEQKYYESISQNMRRKGLFSLIWMGTKRKILYYKLFLSNEKKSLFRFIITWYFNRLKAEWYKKNE